MDPFEAAQSGLGGSGPKGWYAVVAAELDAERLGQLDRALEAEGRITARAVSVVLREWGYSVTEGQVSHYRRRRREL